jgi:hypothetical protein
VLTAPKSIANTLTQVLGFTSLSNTLPAGTVIDFECMALLTNTTSASSSTLTLRINAASLGAVIEASWTVALGLTARTNCPTFVKGQIVVQAGGTTAIGMIAVNCNTTTALATPSGVVTTAVALTPGQSNVVEMTCISGAASTTWNFLTGTIVQY